jgi:hypothetical protein
VANNKHNEIAYVVFVSMMITLVQIVEMMPFAEQVALTQVKF